MFYSYTVKNIYLSGVFTGIIIFLILKCIISIIKLNEQESNVK